MNLSERRRPLMSVNKSLLPKEYQQVEYIEKLNNYLQFIDTGVLTSEENSFEVKAQLLDVEKNSQTIWGGRYSNKQSSMHSNQLSYVKSSSQYQFANGQVSNVGENVEIDKLIHTYYANKNALFIDDVLYITVSIGEITERTSIYLLATNTNGTVGFSGGTIRLYYAKIWQGDNLVRYFIPCYRKNDNIIGLYDIINEKFYTNKGTGEFLMGGKI